MKKARDIIENQLSVRKLEYQTEDAEKKIKREHNVKHNAREFQYVEDLLRDKFDTRVKIKDNKIEISFTNTADLNRILEIIDVKE